MDAATADLPATTRMIMVADRESDCLNVLVHAVPTERDGSLGPATGGVGRGVRGPVGRSTGAALVSPPVLHRHGGVGPRGGPALPGDDLAAAATVVRYPAMVTAWDRQAQDPATTTLLGAELVPGRRPMARPHATPIPTVAAGGPLRVGQTNGNR